MKFVNLSKCNFKCVKCANCCHKVVRETNVEFAYFDCFGNITNNPKTSVAIDYIERQVFEKNIRSKFQIDPKFYPLEVIFLKNFKVGFILNYQIGVINKKNCMFFDLGDKICKIYHSRPTVCRSYPLILNEYDPFNPIPEGACIGLMKEIKRQYPSTRSKGEFIYFNKIKEELKYAFPKEYRVFMNTHNYIISLNSLYFELVGTIFLDISNPIELRKVKNYKFLDLSKFFSWANNNLKDIRLNHLKKKVDRVTKNYSKYLSKFYNERLIH